MKTNQIIVASLVGLTACSSLVLASVYTYADNDTAIDEVTIAVPTACTMTGSVDTNHTATLTPGTYSGTSTDYANGIGKTTLTTFCNDNNGFSIYAIGFTGDTEGTNTLVGANTGATIATKAYESTDTTSNWSMKVTKVTDTTETYNPNNMTITNSYDSWHAVPDDYTKVAEYKSTTEPATTDTTLGAKVETTYAAYVATNQPADTYQGKVKYVMVHPYDHTAPVIPVSVADASTMQEVNACPDTLEMNQVYTLPDSRDNTEYRVARLEDGNCWMLDNLALDLTNATVQANLTSLTTNATDTSLDYLKGINVRNSSTDPDGNYATSAVSTEWNGVSSWSDPKILTSYINTIPLNDYDPLVTTAQSDSWKIGIYYNICAASAGSYCYSFNKNPDVNIQEDICPRGWRLPIGGDKVGEFYALISAISSHTSSYSELYNSVRTALKLPLSGYAYSGTTASQGDTGIWWSSTYDSENDIYRLYATQGSIANSSYQRSRGNNIRCILNKS